MDTAQTLEAEWIQFVQAVLYAAGEVEHNQKIQSVFKNGDVYEYTFSLLNET